MNFREEYNKKLALVENALEKIIERYSSCPLTIYKAVKYSLFAGGKRIRPILLLTAHEMVGGNTEESMELACGLEMIHTYSLVHDDLPAMDDDDMRRGMPTTHKVFGEGIAVLAGDSLLNMAYEVFLDKSLRHPGNLRNHIKAVSVIAAAAGVNGMIGGQVVDLEMEGKPAQPEILDYIHTHKTGALIEASLKAGIVLENTEQKAQEAIAEYGRKLGLAFQIVDDILDVVGDEDSMGKKPKRDEGRKKLTYTAVYGLEKSQRIAEELIEQAVSQLDYFGDKANFLKEIAYYILKRRM